MAKSDTIEKPGPAVPGVFELDEPYIAAMEKTGKRGASTKASPYLDAVKEAIKTGKPKGVIVEGATDDDKLKNSRAIMNQLRRAATQLSAELDADKYVKLTAKPRVQTVGNVKPFVGFTARIALVPANDEEVAADPS